MKRLLVASLLAGCRGAPEQHAPEQRAPEEAPASTTSSSVAGEVIPSDAHGVVVAAVPSLRVHALSRFVWIRSAPTPASEWIGYLWSGGSVAALEETARATVGTCRFHAVAPRGFVCVDDRTATLDAEHPTLRVLRAHAPTAGSALPYRYAALLGTGPRKVPPSLFDQPPPDLHDYRTLLKPHGSIAYTTELGDDVVTSDYARFPKKDLAPPYPESTFSGVRLSGAVTLPIAFFRERDRPRWRDVDGTLVPGGPDHPRLSWVRLTGRSRTSGGGTYLETDDGSFVAEDDAVVPRARARMPWASGHVRGTPSGAGDGPEGRRVPAPRGRRTWIDANALEGWLVAYEGERPVFATMIAPGRGSGSGTSTPGGIFSVTGKFVTATLANDDPAYAEVPWVQNYFGAYAIHSAYWHDAFGERRSSGCLNVSPEDGRTLFAFTEPDVPDGWHAVRADPKTHATYVFVDTARRR